jgi:hypothetical protein
MHSTLSHQFDDAPNFYVNGQPNRTDPTVRTLERNVGALTSPDPYSATPPALCTRSI